MQSVCLILECVGVCVSTFAHKLGIAEQGFEIVTHKEVWHTRTKAHSNAFRDDDIQKYGTVVRECLLAVSVGVSVHLTRQLLSTVISSKKTDEVI